MFTGAITQYIDVAQVVLYIFWAFFVLLVLYLHREAKREGYPLVSDRSTRITHQGFPSMPPPKTYRLMHGGEVTLPGDRREGERELAARPLAKHLGAPLAPTGDPLADGVGPAAWAMREERVDLDGEGGARIRPLSALADHGYAVADFDTDPRGLDVRTLDGEIVGTVKELWVDWMESFPRYVEVTLGSGGEVLVPMMLVTLKKKRHAPSGGSVFDRLHARREKELHVVSVTAAQFANAPTLADPTQVTLREEDRIQAYFGGGHLYATPGRAEPLI